MDGRGVDFSCAVGDTLCQGANAGVVATPVGSPTLGIAYYGVPENLEKIKSIANNLYYRQGGILVHEYIHAVQGQQFVSSFVIGTRTRDNSGVDFVDGMDGFAFLPTWLIEGQAHFQGLATTSVSFTDYLSVTDQMSHRCLFEWSKGSCTSSVDIADYLFIQGRSGEKVLYNLGYSVGDLKVWISHQNHCPVRLASRI